jgi:phage terminase small subunit
MRRNLPTKNAGTSKAAALAARRMFAAAYIINGRNGTQAALAAGRSPAGADTWAVRALKEPAVQAMINELLAQAAPTSGLDVNLVLTETARIIRNDPRRFFKADGTMIPIVEWTDDMAATVASVEAENVTIETHSDGEVKTTTATQVKKIKFWDKNAAIEKGFRHLGLYERDNTQRSENLSLQVVLVGAPTNERG